MEKEQFADYWPVRASKQIGQMMVRRGPCRSNFGNKALTIHFR